MELNEKFKSYQNKARDLDGIETTGDSLREFHLAIENIFDGIKSQKSSRDFKWLFLLLVSLVIAASAIHMIKYGVGFNVIPPLFLAGFWVYYRYTLKMAIKEQYEKNKSIPAKEPGKQEQKQELNNRIQYILNGIEVLYKRIILIRNQYVIFFPVFTIMIVDIIKGPMNIPSLITTTVVSIVLGGIFWIYYFKNELIDLDNSVEELGVIMDNLKQL